MREFVFFLYVKQPHYDSFAMVPVQGFSGTKAHYKDKLEPYFDAHVKSTYPDVYCEIRQAPIIVEQVVNMEKQKIIKTYNERVGKWTKRNLLSQL